MSAVFVCSGLVAGLFLAPSQAEPPRPAPVASQPTQAPTPLVVHEWGTFTSFSGSDGTNVSFYPNNEDLPRFVYQQPGPSDSKSGRLSAGGTVSMETPVLYFYADSPMNVSVKVDFPKGWITEWYPFAVGAPSSRQGQGSGQSIRWNARLLPGEPVRLPVEKESKNNYYFARETDAVPLQAEIETPADRTPSELRGGNVVQREKFLFYRGVGTFPTPVSVKALGDGNVRVRNVAAGRLDGLILVSVSGGQIGFRALGTLEAGSEQVASLLPVGKSKADLTDTLVKALTTAGLYEKEAKAMVKTWDSAWFGEDGTRLLYIVPRSRTDELLPLTLDPKPTEIVRVLVGRHDFLTPEQEGDAERQVTRARAARAELEAAEQQIQRIGRFSWNARQMAEKRLDSQLGRR